MDLHLEGSSATESLGRALARSLPHALRRSTPIGGATAGGAGAVLYLQGELGAGKTTCVRSLLRELGVAGLVRSPTYTLVETYTLADLTCVHVDLYRLRAATEVDELGLRDLAEPGCLLLVEWPEKGGAALPPADMELTLQYAGDARAAHLHAATPLGNLWLEKLGRDTSLSFYVSNLT
jgi:tRNA threonylcarbamoyladenosine biosynthesis protein TsaE